MRIGRWTDNGVLAQGFIDGDRVVSFAHDRRVADVLALGLAAVPGLWQEVHTSPGVPLARVTLLAPLQPATIRDFVAFEEHVEGVSASVDGASEVVPEWYEAPTFYFTNPHTVRAHGDTIRPPVCDRLDFELEVAAVIGAVPGSSGENLTAATAGEHIFGYTIMNDWSARDLQSREMRVRLGPCKGKDFATTLGPWIVTADEFDGFTDDDGFLAVHATVSVNGAPVGEDLLSNMGWPFAELVAYAARNSRVVPGDVLGSGTVGNGGCLAELWGRSGTLLPAPLALGDVVEMTVEGIGTLRNPVGEPMPAPAGAPARQRTRARTRRP